MCTVASGLYIEFDRYYRRRHSPSPHVQRGNYDIVHKTYDLVQTTMLKAKLEKRNFASKAVLILSILLFTK